MSGGTLEAVWKVFGGFLEGVWFLSFASFFSIMAHSLRVSVLNFSANISLLSTFVYSVEQGTSVKDSSKN